MTLSRLAYQLLIKPHLQTFHQQFPQIQLEISLNDAIVNLIEDGFDLGIRFSNRLEEGVIARLLMNAFREGLYVSESYRQRFGIPKTPDDLSQHQLIGYRFISSNRIEPLVLHTDGEDTAFDMPTPLLCNDPEIIAR